MIVQGFWEFKNPLLQLPHITEDNLKYFLAKKVKLIPHEIVRRYLIMLIILTASNQKSSTICTIERRRKKTDP